MPKKKLIQKPLNKAEQKTKSQKTEVKNPIKPELKVHTIDASGKVLGRLSTEVADLLRGKNKVKFLPNI